MNTDPTTPAPSGPVQPVIGHAASVAVPIQPPKGLSSEQRERLRVAEWNFLSRLKSTGHLSKEHPMYHAIPGPTPPQPAPEANRVVTCVYCGHEYPDGTPTAKHDLLTAHIKACEKHPMRDAEARIERLRKALSGLVGAETKKELEAMDVALRIMPGIESDKIAGLNAIHALLHEINSNSKNS